MIDQTLTTPPTAPSSNDIPTFRERFDAFIAWIVTFVSQLTTVISQINSTASTINSKESSATNSASTATTQAGIATTKASEASASATSAYNAQLAAEAVFDSFDDKYLGAKATAPTVDNDGNPLVTGALFFKTTSPKGIYVYDAELATWSIFSYVPTSHETLSGRADADSHPMSAITGLMSALDGTKGSAIASASTITIGTTGIGNTIHITGTTTITSLGNASAGVMRTLIFDGILTLTHNATSLILPDATNIITAAGDSAEFVCDTTNNWKLLRYTRSVTPASIQIATTAEVQAGIDNTKAISPLALMGALANSKTTNGYCKLPNGLILQWGFLAGGTVTDRTVTFPIAFPNACLNASLSPTKGDATPYGMLRNATSGGTFTTTTLYIKAYTVATSEYYWFAIGY